MRHVIFHGDKQISIGNSAMPEPAAGELLLRVKCAAVCASDNLLWQQGSSCIPGQSVAAVVEQAGHDRDGERVGVYNPVFCGHCRACRSAHTQSCSNHSTQIGLNRDGGFAEYLRVPEHCLLPIPAAIDQRLATLLPDVVATAAHAVRLFGRLRPADTGCRVLVCGAGLVGIGVLIALQDAGFQHIEIVDSSEQRQIFAQQFAKQAMQRSEHAYDAVFDCGYTPAQFGAHDIAAGGAFIQVDAGAMSAPSISLPAAAECRHGEFYLLRSWYYPISEHVENIDLLLRQQKQYEKIIDKVADLDEFAETFSRFCSGELRKPLLTFETP